MDLFEKIEMFEKMANQLSETAESNSDKDVETIEEFQNSQVRKEAVKVRASLLTDLVK